MGVSSINPKNKGHCYGNWYSLRFQHSGKWYWAFYGHLMSLPTPQGSICEGAMIALTGRTGAEGLDLSEAHLHFEIRTIQHPAAGLAGRIDPAEIFGDVHNFFVCPRT
jgi:hypothetical protein